MRNTSSQRVAFLHMKKAKLFGLISNHIGMQDLKRYKNQLRWMFKKDQHTVSSKYQGSDLIITVSSEDSVARILGLRKGKSGVEYNNLSLEIDGRVIKKTEDMDEIKRIIFVHFKMLGLRPS